MAIYNFEGRTPKISESAYVFPSATIIGDVEIGDEVWIGPGAVIRGDYGSIHVDSFSAIEDNCVIHARPGEKTYIGKHVTMGHLSVVHTGTVKEWAVLGMGCTVSDFATVGRWAAIGEGAVVRARFQVDDESIAVGVPAKVVGKVSDEYKTLWMDYKKNYNTFCSRYRKLKEIENHFI